jgi:hypothetical protein
MDHYQKSSQAGGDQTLARWLTYARSHQFDRRLIQFIQANPQQIDWITTDPAVITASPARLEKVNEVLQKHERRPVHYAMVSAICGPGFAKAFLSYLQDQK